MHSSSVLRPVPNHARPLSAASALALALALSACGGGGGSAVSSTPPPAPAPTPAPSPAPSPTPAPSSVFNTTEFRRSNGPDQHGAVVAWQAGNTGKNQTIAIVDSGIDTTNSEFAGRILAASRDVAGGSRSIKGEDDHGTNVALVAVAARDGNGILGMAFDASLLVLRADTPGSCTATGPSTTDSSCTFMDTNIARGVDAAVAAGARVINISLGGPSPASAGLVDAVRKASAAGVVVVVAAGNGGDGSRAGVDPNQPNASASSMRAAGGDNVIIVGSVDEGNQLSTFSQRAGTEAAWYLTARGERVCCVYSGSQIYVGHDASGSFNLLFSGTSFATPQVAGAVALLAQAFPTLTGKQIVRLLLDSARDAGAAGVDPVYGAGILDIAAAMAPRGALSLPGVVATAPIGTPGQTSTAMGDALVRGAPLTGVALDSYQRAYTVNLASGLRGAALRGRVHGALARGTHVAGLGGGPVSLAFTVGETGRADAAQQQWTRELRLTGEQAEGARMLAARAVARLAPGTTVALGFGEGANGLSASLQGAPQPAFLIAGDARGERGVERRNGSAFAVRHTLGPVGVTVSAERGEVAMAGADFGPYPALRAPSERGGFSAMTITADRRFGAVAASVSASWLGEGATLLGGDFTRAWGGKGASTLFLDAAAGWDFAPGWRLGAAWRQGFTHADPSGAVGTGSNLASNAWSLDLSRDGVFGAGDSFGFRLSQPLRVTGGGLALDLPVAYDYGTLRASYDRQVLSLAPRGREIDAELAWRAPLWGGKAAASVFYRRNAGHYTSVPADGGVALRWEASF